MTERAGRDLGATIEPKGGGRQACETDAAAGRTAKYETLGTDGCDYRGGEPSSRDPELYWLVDDAEEAFRELSQKAEVVAPLEQMPFGKVFSIKEPGGRPRFLLELSRDRPSRPA